MVTELGLVFPATETGKLSLLDGLLSLPLDEDCPILPGPPPTLPCLPLLSVAMEPGLLLNPLLPFVLAISGGAGPDTLLRVLLLADNSCSDTFRNLDAELNVSSLSVVACELVSKLYKLLMTSSLSLILWLTSLLSTGDVELSEDEE